MQNSYFLDQLFLGSFSSKATLAVYLLIGAFGYYSGSSLKLTKK